MVDIMCDHQSCVTNEQVQEFDEKIQALILALRDYIESIRISVVNSEKLQDINANCKFENEHQQFEDRFNLTLTKLDSSLASLNSKMHKKNLMDLILSSD